jgi:DNA-binding NtrC family response regulator
MEGSVTLTNLDHKRNALALVLSPRRYEAAYRSRFARRDSAAIAIANTERETFDVVLSDLRLGQEESAAVLAQARGRLPTARRVLMTGALGPDVRASVPAHALLLKPFALGDLFGAVEAE